MAELADTLDIGSRTTSGFLYTYRELSKAMVYINFSFKNLVYDDDTFEGEFEAKDINVSCKFIHDRKSKQTEISDNDLPAEEILPLPIYWLEYKLKQDGTLDANVSKISC